MSHKTKTKKVIRYRLVVTNWTEQETWKGKRIKKGQVIEVSSADLKDKGLKRRLGLSFELIEEDESKEETIIGSETIESAPIELIDNQKE